MNDERASRLFQFSMLGVAAVQLLTIALSPLNLSPDEAQYWEWSRRLDWSYYSKGPFIAVVIKAGTLLFGADTFGVRVPSVFFMLFALLMLWKTLLLVSAPRFAFPVWFSALSMLIILQSGLAISTDSPCAACWITAIYAALRALQSPRWWLLFGFAIGLGFLAKFTSIILFPSVLLFLVVSEREKLRSGWLYLGMAITAIALIPVVYWNSTHGWVNFAHNAGHVVKAKGIKFKPQYFLELVGGQLGMAGPLVFIGLMLVLVSGAKAWRRGDKTAGLLFCTSAPLLLLCVLISFTKSVYANWPLPIYLGALVLAAHLFSRGELPPLIPKNYRLSLQINGIIAFIAYLLFFGVTAGLPPRLLPIKKLIGWSQLGASIDQILDLNAMSAVVTIDYGSASEIAFYSAHHPQTLCAVVDERRMNQYDVWGGWEKMRGKKLLLVLRQPVVPPDLARRFLTIDPLEPKAGLPVIIGRAEFRRYYFFSGTSYDGSVPPIPIRR